MKTRFPSILGAFVAILMVASFMIPYGLASPPSGDSASASIVKWDTIAPSTLIESSASPPVSSISIRIAELATAAYWPKILNIDTISSSMSILASPSPPAQALVTRPAQAGPGQPRPLGDTSPQVCVGMGPAHRPAAWARPAGADLAGQLGSVRPSANRPPGDCRAAPAHRPGRLVAGGTWRTRSAG